MMSRYAPAGMARADSADKSIRFTRVSSMTQLDPSQNALGSVAMSTHMRPKWHHGHFYIEIALFPTSVRVTEFWCQNERSVRPGNGTQSFALCALVFHHQKDFLLQVRYLDQTRFGQIRMDYSKEEIGSNRVAVLAFQNVPTQHATQLLLKVLCCCQARL